MYYNTIIQEDLYTIANRYKYDLSQIKNKTILITGATGMLATYYMFALMYLNDHYDYGIKIYALARNAGKLSLKIPGIEKRADIIPVIQDITDKIQIDDNVDFVLHAAGVADPQSLSETPYNAVSSNVLGTKNSIDFAVEKNAKLIYTSTREVYGEVEATTISEEDTGKLDQTEVRSCYPESKRLGENMIICAAKQYGLEYTITRLAHAYGPGMKIRNDGRIMSDLICAAVDDKDIILTSSGNQLRAFCYIADAVSALLFATISNERLLNISNESEEVSIIDLANKIASIYNLKVLIKQKHNDDLYVKFTRVALNNTRLMNLGWKPVYSLEDGIRRTVIFTKSNP